MPGWIAGGAIIGGLASSSGAKKAAAASAAAGQAATDETKRQFNITQKNMLPFQEAALGKAQYGWTNAYQDAKMREQEKLRVAMESGDTKAQAEAENWLAGNDQNFNQQMADNPGQYKEITGYEGGGALDQYTDYGRSQVDPSQIITQGNQPKFNQQTQFNNELADYNVNKNVQGQVSEFGQGSRQSQYGGQNFDITKDPSYQFRQAEQERGINRNMAGMGKFQSGNRMDEIMKRSGEMASQEYGAAYGRNVQDFQLGQGVNRENYGRDVGEYGLQRSAEDASYGRNVDQYGRDVADYNVQQGRNQAAYGRQTDAYGRELTQYNADVAQNQNTYDRQSADYARQYGAEGDYLNRLSNISGMGQTATTNMATLGAQASGQISNNMLAAGQTEAAGYMGQAANVTGMMGDAMSMYGAMNTPQYTPYGGSLPTTIPQGISGAQNRLTNMYGY